MIRLALFVVLVFSFPNMVVEEREEEGGGEGEARGRRGTKDKRRKRFDSRVTLSRFLPPSANNPPPLSLSSLQQIPSEISQIHIPTISTADIA